MTADEDGGRRRRAEAEVERGRRRAERSSKDNVVACRLDDDALAALDALVEAGVRGTRSEAAAWLINAGLQLHQPLLDDVAGTVSEIRRLKAEARLKAQRHASSS